MGSISIILSTFLLLLANIFLVAGFTLIQTHITMYVCKQYKSKIKKMRVWLVRVSFFSQKFEVYTGGKSLPIGSQMYQSCGYVGKSGKSFSKRKGSLKHYFLLRVFVVFQISKICGINMYQSCRFQCCVSDRDILNNMVEKLKSDKEEITYFKNGAVM